MARMNLHRCALAMLAVPLVCGVSQGQWGGEPPAPPASDRQFVADVGPGLDVYQCGGQLVIQIPIDRYVGPTNADGTLSNVEDLISDGVVLPWAELEMPAFDVDWTGLPGCSTPERDEVFFNDQRTDTLRNGNSRYLQGGSLIWQRNTFQIPIQAIKFPSSPGFNGQRPTPAMNTVRIDIDTLQTGCWCVEISWVKLRIGAMSPTVLIHGNSQDGTWWGRHNFTRPFASPYIPWDTTISFSGRAGVISANRRVVNGNILLTRLPAVAREWGVDSIHLVAHSKGGLDCREYLGHPRRPAVPEILSLTTLSTPHDGSILADVQRALHSTDFLLRGAPLLRDDFGLPVVGFENFDTIYSIGAQLSSTNPGHRDLMIASCGTFNRANVPRLPRTTWYLTFGADLDLNGTRSLDTVAETAELPLDDSQVATGMQYAQGATIRMLNSIYQTLAYTRRVFVTATPINGQTYLTLAAMRGGFLPNDILVPTPSAHGFGSGYGALIRFPVTGFQDYTGLNGRNHASIGNGGVARDVRREVINCERTIGDLTP